LESESEQVQKAQPLNEDIGIFNRPLANDFQGFGRVMDQEPESQLGKGLIKPCSVELEIDGFHFKYDKPVRNFVRPENMKEKVVEFRVTCPDPGSGPGTHAGEVVESFQTPKETVFEEVSQADTVSQEVGAEVSQQITDGVQNFMPEDAVKTETADSTVEPENQNINPLNENMESVPDAEMWVAGDIVDGPEDGTLETRFMPNFEMPEPELETSEDRVILWEDSRHWLGIPLANQYRISNGTLQIIDRLARKFSEVDLVLISEVRLRQSWLDKLLNTGDLTIFVKHLPDTGLKLSGVRNPEKVRRLIEELRVDSLN
jgi:hypothetical protein